MFTGLLSLATHVLFLRKRKQEPPLHPPGGAVSLRGKLLNTEQLEQLARTIAAEHPLLQHHLPIHLLRDELDRNERILHQAYQQICEATNRRRPIAPAADWLRDNFSIVVDQINEIRVDLPPGYYQQLPKLQQGPYRQHPRVYALAIELIRHTDGRIDSEQLLRFITAYQSVTPLTMGELWAVAIMLRIGLVANLCHLAVSILKRQRLQIEAEQWAERLLESDATITEETLGLLTDLKQQYISLPSSFAVQLMRRLQNYEERQSIGLIIDWLESHIIEQYSSIDTLFLLENQQQVVVQASVGNTVTSMRTLNSIQWKEWFEHLSLVEQILRQDPAGVYPRSTFATRDHYRHEIERLAHRLSQGEDDVARQLVAYANRQPADAKERYRHIGYYLVDEGRSAFEEYLGYRSPPAEFIQRLLMRYPTLFYLGLLTGGTVATIGVAWKTLLTHQERKSMHPIVRLVLPGVMFIPTSALLKGLVDYGLTHVLPPRLLPRLDLSKGIPADLRTIVVIPTLLLTKESVLRQLESIEVLYLANKDPHIHFALLSDFADAPAPEMPEDSERLECASERIDALNQRYGSDRFFLFHRRRVWNAAQGCYMGWERKRGKLEEFNRLLQGADDTTYTTMLGDVSVLQHIRYVITLDADTQLLRDVARTMIGTMAHPLNQAELDPQTRQVVQGYGILQPRISIDPVSATRTHFTRLFSGNVGIDPYTTAVSDVYMDLFGEGIYAGKGIYDPSTFNKTLTDRFPDNTLLSHDLFEGSYVRAGFLSDVELLDSYPETYAAYSARHHRWVRGDWQIGGWLLPLVPHASGGTTHNNLSLIARFRIGDNLRRSLVPPATMALLAIGWLRFPRHPAAWTAFSIAHLALPPIFDLVSILASVLHGKVRPTPLFAQTNTLRIDSMRFILNLALMPDMAKVNLDAIVRTLIRMFFTHRNLLEWETAAQSQYRLRTSHKNLMGHSILWLTLGIIGIWIGRHHLRSSWWAAAPVVADWLGSPLLVAWVAQSLEQPARPIQAEEQALLRRLARTTWTFFEDFVTAEGNYLAPDNFQETPLPVIAYRTSTTNIGLQLLADLAAYDFGYIGMCELTERTERVFATMDSLERYRGHFLNWYNIQTREALSPAYVSTVDNGNLAGHLLTLVHPSQVKQFPILSNPRLLRTLGSFCVSACQYSEYRTCTSEQIG